MSITNELIQDNPDKYETLLESRILGKQLQMKLNQYKAIQNQYDTLLQYENNNRKRASVEVKKLCIDKNASCPQWKSCCPGGSGSNSSVTCGPIDWMKENCQQTCDTCEKEEKPIQPSGYWTDIADKNYQTGMVASATGSTDSWKFLGKTDNLTNCKLKAVEDKNTAFSSVVYYPSDFGNSWNKSCFGGVKGKNVNPQQQPKTITSLAPNGTTILGGDEGGRLLKEMKKLKTEITALTKKAKKNGSGLYKTRNLLSDELSTQNNVLEILLDKLQKDRNEINIMLSEPDETAGEEDSSIRQSSSYTTYALWMLLVMVSIFVAYHIYSREIYDISIWAYVFIVVWIVIIVNPYYGESKEYGRKSWNYVSSFIPNLPI